MKYILHDLCHLGHLLTSILTVMKATSTPICLVCRTIRLTIGNIRRILWTKANKITSLRRTLSHKKTAAMLCFFFQLEGVDLFLANAAQKQACSRDRVGDGARRQADN